MDKNDKIFTLVYTSLMINQNEMHGFQILLLKHVPIIIKIKQMLIKTDKQMWKRKYSKLQYVWCRVFIIKPYEKLCLEFGVTLGKHLMSIKN